MNRHAFPPPAARRSIGMVALVMLTFFVISLLTNIVGPLVPDIIKSFDLSLTLVGPPALRLLHRLRRHVHPLGHARRALPARSRS